jgi:hypothetical protein
VVEEAAELLVHLRCRPIASLGSERVHQLALCRFAERIDSDSETEPARRAGMLSTLGRLPGERLEGCQVSLLARLPLFEHPLGRAPFKQHPTAQRHGALQ